MVLHLMCEIYLIIRSVSEERTIIRVDRFSRRPHCVRIKRIAELLKRGKEKEHSVGIANSCDSSSTTLDARSEPSRKFRDPKKKFSRLDKVCAHKTIGTSFPALLKDLPYRHETVHHSWWAQTDQ